VSRATANVGSQGTLWANVRERTSSGGGVSCVTQPGLAVVRLTWPLTRGDNRSDHTTWLQSNAIPAEAILLNL